MKSHAVEPLPWGRIGLTVLPGIWLVLGQNGGVLPPLFAIVGTFAITVLIALGLISLSFIRERHIGLWCLPVFGTMAWEGGQFVNQLLLADREGWISLRLPTTLQEPVSVLAIVLIFGAGLMSISVLPYWIYRQLGRTMHRSGWGVLAILVLSGILLCLVPGDTYRLNELYFYLLLFLVPVAAGVYWVGRYGLAASLLVIACEPAWIDLIYASRGTTYRYLYDTGNAVTGAIPILHGVLLALLYIPLIMFLIIIPVGLARCRSTQGQVRWLLWGSLGAVSVTLLLPAVVFAAIGMHYTVNNFLAWGDAIILFWLPLVLCALVYETYSAGDIAQSAAPVPR